MFVVSDGGLGNLDATDGFFRNVVLIDCWREGGGSRFTLRSGHGTGFGYGRGPKRPFVRPSVRPFVRTISEP